MMISSVQFLLSAKVLSKLRSLDSDTFNSKKVARFFRSAALTRLAPLFQTAAPVRFVSLFRVAAPFRIASVFQAAARALRFLTLFVILALLLLV